MIGDIAFLAGVRGPAIGRLRTAVPFILRITALVPFILRITALVPFILRITALIIPFVLRITAVVLNALYLGLNLLFQRIVGTIVIM
jgi:hypothetical protein